MRGLYFAAKRIQFMFNGSWSHGPDCSVVFGYGPPRLLEGALRVIESVMGLGSGFVD